MTLDIDDDYLLFDGPVTATVVLKSANNGGQTDVANVPVMMYELSKRDIALFGGALIGGERAASIPVALVAELNAGDRIIETESGAEWTIVAVSLATLRTRWRAAIRNAG